ncbi:MAG: 4-hydroxythreonine-4-phosphate dehydrogenase PdxA [Planctomycetales bacterium]
MPRIALTLGDVAGIGPEVVVRAWSEARLHEWCQPIVVGHPEVVRRAVQLVGAPMQVHAVARLDEGTPDPSNLLCWNPAEDEAADVRPGRNDARAGRAAFEYLRAAATAAREGQIDALTTAPLSKAALHLAGLHYPGHTEILAELCGVREFAMMLYLSDVAGFGKLRQESSKIEHEFESPETSITTPHALGVTHVTLHTSLRSVPELLTTPGILEKITLLDRFLKNLGTAMPRIGVCALNPHAGEDGLFGDEESRLIAPAVASAAQRGILATGPLPADALIQRACRGEFDGVVAMYHDQGHIPLKLVGNGGAVNVTLGLPIVRTSPSHGTAFDIAWQGRASGRGMVEAVRVAARLTRSVP